MAVFRLELFEELDHARDRECAQQVGVAELLLRLPREIPLLARLADAGIAVMSTVDGYAARPPGT